MDTSTIHKYRPGTIISKFLKHSQNSMLINEKLLFYHRTLSGTDDFRFLHEKEINFRLLNQQHTESMFKRT